MAQPPYTRRAKECLGVLAMAECVTRPSLHSATEKDGRIDNVTLKARVSEYEALKLNNSEQNSYWYNEFYRPSNKQDEVASTHRSYLLYRDAAAVSLISVLILITGKLLFRELLMGISFESFGVFAVAVMGFIVAARNAGQRLVTTAVAVSLC